MAEKMGWCDNGNTEGLNKIPIWGKTIPGNSNTLKHKVMDLNPFVMNGKLWTTIRWIRALTKKKINRRLKRSVDLYTDMYVKPEDVDYRDTFSDIPYILPYVVKGSKAAIIVVSGGGYCLKSMESEGTQIAEALNRQGISAFVLWYRTNPYYQPYPLMDLQRAVRYIRYHSDEYGIDKEKIGAIGFSAGGVQVSLFANVLRNNIINIPEYDKDEIDYIDDHLNFMALLYPALSYNYNGAMLFASFSAEEVEDEDKRKHLMQTYNALEHFSAVDIPHFISYGSKDTMVSLDEIKEYIKLLEGQCPKTVIVEGAGHGYGAAVGKPEAYWLDEYINWIKSI